MRPTILQFVIPVVLFLLIGAAGWIGLAIGTRSKGAGTGNPQFGIILSAILALLGLMLSFTFSGSMTRFGQRQEIMVAEANAIGTAWLRTDLLAEPHRSQVRTLLRAYVDARIELFNTPQPEVAVPVQKRLQAMQTDIWAAAVAGVKDQPAVTILVLSPLNELFDRLSARNAAVRRHTPGLVLVVLIVCAVAAMTTVGFGLASAAARRIGLHATVLGFLIVAALWITIDMDYLNAGLIRVSGQPLFDLRDAIAASPS